MYIKNLNLLMNTLRINQLWASIIRTVTVKKTADEDNSWSVPTGGRTSKMHSQSWEEIASHKTRGSVCARERDAGSAAGFACDHSSPGWRIMLLPAAASVWVGGRQHRTGAADLPPMHPARKSIPEAEGLETTHASPKCWLVIDSVLLIKW